MPPTASRVQLLFVLALLKPGVSIEQARADLNAIHARVERRGPRASGREAHRRDSAAAIWERHKGDPNRRQAGR